MGAASRAGVADASVSKAVGRGLGWGHWASTGIAWGTESPLTGYGGEDLREHCWMSQRITAAELCAGPFFAEVGHRCQAEVPAPRSHPAAPSLLPLCHTHAQAPLQPPNLGLTVDLNLMMLRGSRLALSGWWGGRKGLGRVSTAQRAGSTTHCPHGAGRTSLFSCSAPQAPSTMLGSKAASAGGVPQSSCQAGTARRQQTVTVTQARVVAAAVAGQ